MAGPKTFLPTSFSVNIVTTKKMQKTEMLREYLTHDPQYWKIGHNVTKSNTDKKLNKLFLDLIE